MDRQDEFAGRVAISRHLQFTPDETALFFKLTLGRDDVAAFVDSFAGTQHLILD